MSTITKAKINLKEGTIELEGSEAFVTKQLEAFQQQLKDTKLPRLPEKTKTSADEAKPEKQPKKKTGKTPQTIAPIPLELKAKDGKPALRDFFNGKNPKSNQENVTVFAYYLKKYLNINDIKAGHVVSCCKEVNRKVPTNIPQMFKNIQHRLAWLDVGTGGESASITNQGENFVEYDLPRKDNASKDKTAT